MSNIHLYSDPHFGHNNMAIKRGFSSSKEMDEYIIESWNKVISKRDVVWILGDITMEKDNYLILNELNGIKKVVLGNHDMPQHVPSLLKHVNYVCGMFKLKNYILTHCPIHESEINRFTKNIHGHIHDSHIQKTEWNYFEFGIIYTKDIRYINVCAEVINYTPVRLDSI